jgi:hypothetical protein
MMKLLLMATFSTNELFRAISSTFLKSGTIAANSCSTSFATTFKRRIACCFCNSTGSTTSLAVIVFSVEWI